MARFDRAIPPGGEGKIVLTLNPKACRGSTKKSTVVTCNDPKQPYFILTMEAHSRI